ncbi:UDP-N-acetylmuramate--L-alanine ligase [Gehongia tenuis]|uniref:UDP-N-acetylmuramate--L-alanine ligase n=1 Tax=Gehongia tenuis TaxID=2763655 RepID=A0A926HQP3_9FIRM|nr:UDP-N-acetylmuramate--L-alanine ligase [Gehongia tenuis]MBC8531950.1 UDP-N-acetylmuramate--L-alanine ligase [Gehongia tenuis]
MINLEDYKGRRVHFVGIGGISMSGLAEILLHRGYKVTGSDINRTNLTERLEDLGAVIQQGHEPQLVNDADLLVYTAAVKPDNPERKRAGELGIPEMERAALLGEIMKQYPVRIGIAGTHGKTTATSMTACILELANLHPTIHIGGELDLIGGNTKAGNGEIFIFEACEYVDSFLQFHPTIAVVLNVDLDHLDHFKNMDHIKRSFERYLALLPEDGLAIGLADDANTLEVLKSAPSAQETFGVEGGDDVQAKNLDCDNRGHFSFDLFVEGTCLGRIALAVPGRHNVLNALAASAVALKMGLGIEDIQRGLEAYTGTHRRFELEGELMPGVSVYHDYAHHPTEVKATLATARALHPKRLWCVFQPHTYTRTAKLFELFVDAFSDADEVIVAPIYAAREPNDGQNNDARLAQRLNEKQSAIFLNSFDTISCHLADHCTPGDMVLILGAGDIEKLAIAISHSAVTA